MANVARLFVEYSSKGYDKVKSQMSTMDREGRSVEDRFKSIGATVLKTGAVLGAAFTAMSIGALKLASDAEETDSKLNTVFSNIQSEAQKTSENLVKNFGLSSQSAKQLLGDTGDLLTGFGFTQESALGLSDQVQQLAVDLASFTNFSGGAEGASQALTKALLGERESVKQLGISILETDVQAKILQLTQQGLTFETERQAKAYATLLIAQEQSKNAIGDFARTSDGFANQVRILRGEITDLAIEFGKELLPAGKAIITVIRQMLADFRDTDSIKTFGRIWADTMITGAKLALELRKAWLSFKGFFTGSALAIADAIQGLNNAFGRALIAVGRFTGNEGMEQLGNEIRQGLLPTLKDLHNDMVGIKEDFDETDEYINQLDETYKRLTSTVETEADKVVKANNDIAVSAEQTATRIAKALSTGLITSRPSTQGSFINSFTNRPGSALAPQSLALNPSNFTGGLIPDESGLQDVSSDLAKINAGEGIKAFVTNAQEIANAVGGNVGGAFSAVGNFLSGNIGGGVAELITLTANNSKDFANVLGKINDFVGKIFGILGDILAPILEGIGEILEAFMPIFELIGDILKPIGHFIGEIFSEIAIVITPLIELIANLLEPLEPLLDLIFDAVKPLAHLIEGLFDALSFDFDFGGGKGTIIPGAPNIIPDSIPVIGGLFADGGISSGFPTGIYSSPVTNGRDIAGEAGMEAIIPIPSGAVKAVVTDSKSSVMVEELRSIKQSLLSIQRSQFLIVDFNNRVSRGDKLSINVKQV